MIDPFRPGEELKASKLEAVRMAAVRQTVPSVGLVNSSGQLLPANASRSSSSSLEVRFGIVQSTGGEADWDNTNDQLEFGDVDIYPLLKAAELPAWDKVTTYSEDDKIYFNAEPFNEATEYEVGDYMARLSVVYRCNTETTGTYNGAHWDNLGLVGPWRATTTVLAGDFDDAEWVYLNKDRFIDRNKPTITKRNSLTVELTEGALVGWLGEDLIVATCATMEGWS